MTKYFMILCCIFASSCSTDHAEQNRYSKDAAQDNTMGSSAIISEDLEIEPPRTINPRSPSEYSLEKGSKIIKRGSMKFEVSNLDKVKSEVDSILNSTKGYYENEQFQSYGNRISYSLVIRVPHQNFDAVVKSLENGIGALKNKSIQSEDVTEEYVDLNIRLESKIAYLEQYKIILNSAKSIKDVLEVQEKIRRIEEEIESKKGRIRFIDDKAKYSTLNLEITELIIRELTNKPNFGRRLVNALNNGVKGFLDFAIMLLNFWPFLILITILVLGRKPIISRFKK